ncbi:MAG: hypothetical protein ACHQU0_02735 [Candidatus Paceibacteria bacterium]
MNSLRKLHPSNISAAEPSSVTLLHGAGQRKLFVRSTNVIQLPEISEFVAWDFLNESLIQSELSSRFENKFLAKVEHNRVSAEPLAVYQLCRRQEEVKIVATLGGFPKIEISLGQYFHAFLEQSEGQKGPLRTDGFVNVGFVRLDTGPLQVVSGTWLKSGKWYFDAEDCSNRYFLRHACFIGRP